VAAPV
jgi:hypothetical protein